MSGDGSTQGTCEANEFCNVDGSCTVCSSTEGGHAGTTADAHTGCSANYPKCVSGKCYCIGTATDANAVGDGTVQGSCASSSVKCQSDGTCGGTYDIKLYCTLEITR